jgi:hypothetical protein
VRPIYVETLIRADLNAVWQHTRTAAAHQRWDLRFTEIADLEPTEGAQRFRYATLVISGTGATVGEKERPDGTRTSALRFASPDRLSPIREGAGYWRYIPVEGGVRFVTGYDYTPGWGRVPDLLVRPRLGWATAWSFDRLRLWIERGITPEQSRNRAVLDVAARVLLVGGAVATAPAVVLGLIAAAAVLLPPLPGTPLARRCLRRAPDRRAARAPATLRQLEQP